MRKKETLPFATWLDLESIVLSEISQTEKGKYCILSLICGIWKKKKKVKHIETERVVARAWVRGGMGNGERFIKGYKTLKLNKV